jgi:hypothetical protein
MSDLDTKISLTLKKINIYGLWSYNTENDDCVICRQNLQIPPQKSKSENKVNGSITIGLCKHGFHESCINRWTSSDNISCPICRTLWRPVKKTGGTVYLYNN